MALQSTVSAALTVALLAAMAPCAGAGALVYTRGSDTPREASKIRYAAETKEYILIIDGAEIGLPLAEVDRVEVPRPKALDDAEQMMEAGNHKAAIPLLFKVAQKYAMLNWDVAARELLVVAYMQSGDNARAMSTYRDLVRKTAADKLGADARLAYWNLLISEGKLQEVAAELDNVIAQGTREAAAAATLTRANIFRAQNKTREALMVYLRTVLLYDDIPDVQPEALFRAAEMMDTIPDPRASELRQRLIQQHPDSPQAKQTGQL